MRKGIIVALAGIVLVLAVLFALRFDNGRRDPAGWQRHLRYI